MKHKECSMICFALTYHRPDFQLLSKLLKQYGFLGTILLDLRGCNGVTGNRFFHIPFDGNQLDSSKIKSIDVEQLNEELFEICSNFYETVDQSMMV